MNKNNLYIMYGNQAKSMAIKIMEEANIERDIKDKDALIAIKPNLVVARPQEEGATTDPNLVEGVILYLKSKGFHNISIMEGSWVGDRTSRAFKACGYERLSKKYNVPLIDLQRDSSRAYNIEGEDIFVCDSPMEADYLINMPVLKGHCQTRITCALKNMKGCIPDREKRRFHTMGLHRPIAYLNKALKQDLIIVDGIIGDLNFEEGGNPVQMNRVILGKDPVLLDSYVAELLGYKKEDIAYIAMSEDLNVGKSLSPASNIIEINKDDMPTTIAKSRQVERLAKYISEDMACSACYGSLIHALDRLDDRGLLRNIKEEIHIGQGYKDKSFEGLGIGICTKNLSKSLPGCPPRAKDIIDFLLENL